MRLSVIRTLSWVLFKSYFRAGRGEGRGGGSSISDIAGRFFRPRVILILYSVAFVASFLLVQLVLPFLENVLAEDLVWQLLIGLPMILTSGVIIAGILFELGQGAGVSPSEAVNWLPISPREYVAASSLSTAAAYFPLFAIGAGATLPLSLEFNLFSVWSVAAILSILALLLGAFIVEILAAVNRVSSKIYRKSGKFAILSRIVLIVLFAVIQVAFNPYFLFHVLGDTASVLGVTWFVPMIWPSVAITNLIRLDTFAAVIFSTLSVAFVLTAFLAASYLRQKFWSPTHISITTKSSIVYEPQTPSLLQLGFSPLETAIALKEFRALARRRDLARFMAIPVVYVIALTLPVLFSPSDDDFLRGSFGFFLAAMVPFIIPLMLSSITVGQEGKAIVRILMLPIRANSFIKGKLLPAWIISIISSIGTVIIFRMLGQMPLPAMWAIITASVFVVVVESFVGLGIGARYPDFTVSARSRYITLTGFIRSIVIGGPPALAIFAPITFYIISGVGIMEEGEQEVDVLIPPFDIAFVFLTTAVIGSVLSYLAYRFCRRGVERFLTNLEA